MNISSGHPADKEAILSVQYDAYLITTDKNLLQVEAMHKWLSEVSYWSRNMPLEVARGAFDNSFCIGALKGEQQVGFGRLVTDYYTFAYLADVYVLDEHRGKGLGKEMMRLLFDLDWVKALRRMMLSTRDMQRLYSKVGFIPLRYPERLMELTRPGIYGDDKNPC